MGINTPLVDREGYPRADIDVFRARTLRKRFIEVQNDYKAMQKKIERGLVELQAISVSGWCIVLMFALLLKFELGFCSLYYIILSCAPFILSLK